MAVPLSRRRFLHTSMLAGAGLLVAACGDDDDATRAPITPDGEGAVGERDLPPSARGELVAIFDPRFAPLGQHVTRIGLYDLSEGFDRSAAGDHLAIYVEPIDPAGAGWDAERYLQTAVPGFAAAVPFALERWPGLNSVDVCQEPPQEQNAAPEPPIETQLNVDREAAATIDWATADLAALLVVKERFPEPTIVRVRQGLEDHPLWVAAREAAAERA